VSPASRAQETASALGLRFATRAEIGTDATAAGLIAAIGWPTRAKDVLIVGHQPTLGRVAATLLSGAEADWHFAKGSLWWLRHVEGETKLFAVMHPKLA
jgi:phosphohistidine phosphatase